MQPKAESFNFVLIKLMLDSLLQKFCFFCLVYLLIGITGVMLMLLLFRMYRNRNFLNLPPKYRHTMRQDKSIWKEQELIKGCFIRLPLHAFVYFTCVISCWVLTRLKMIFGLSPKIVHAVTSATGKLACRVIFDLKIKPNVTTHIDSPLVISNHASDLDVFYMFTHYDKTNSFIAKKGVDKKLFYGTIGINYLRNIYLDRDQKHSRDATRKIIQQRVQSYLQNPKEQYPLVIFPQATVSSQHGLLQFKTGVFQPLVPITLISIRYDCPHFQVYIGQMPHWRCLLSILCLRPTLTVNQHRMQALEGESVSQYSQRCRKQ